MSQPTVERVIIRETQSNSLGIAGFIVSLVGFLGGCFGGALLCPIGLILSAVAIRRPPKGFAIAGLILGILGSLWLLIGVLFLGGIGALSLAALSGFKDQIRFVAVDSAIQHYYNDSGFLPASLSEVESKYSKELPAEISKDMVYRPTSLTGYEIRLPGPDKMPGTADDVTHTAEVTKNGAGAGMPKDAGVTSAPTPPAVNPPESKDAPK